MICKVRYIENQYRKNYPALADRLTTIYNDAWKEVTSSKLFRKYGDGDDATGTDIGMGALHILAIEADAAFSHNLLRKRAGFGEPGEEEKFIEPHKLLSL